jgi:Fe2+-dicitrate sensor, membrane component
LNNRVQLSSGESVRIIDQGLQPKEKTVAEEIGSWQKGIARFYSEPLKNVITALENQFGVNINLTVKQEEKFSGSFLYKDVATAFKMVFDPMGLTYTKEADGTYLVSKK